MRGTVLTMSKPKALLGAALAWLAIDSALDGSNKFLGVVDPAKGTIRPVHHRYVINRLIVVAGTRLPHRRRSAADGGEAVGGCCADCGDEVLPDASPCDDCGDLLCFDCGEGCCPKCEEAFEPPEGSPMDAEMLLVASRGSFDSFVEQIQELAREQEDIRDADIDRLLAHNREMARTMDLGLDREQSLRSALWSCWSFAHTGRQQGMMGMVVAAEAMAVAIVRAHRSLADEADLPDLDG